MQPREKPILFNTAMVRAILDGRKTQTRRVIKVNNPDEWEAVNNCRAHEYGAQVPCYLFRLKASEEEGIHYPRYDIGDILWVRETWQKLDSSIALGVAHGNYAYVYKASENGEAWARETEGWTWRPSIHMPKEAARIFLRVTGVRVERLQDITTTDAMAEGFKSIGAFREAFDKILLKKDGSDWYTNPWLWVIEFERIKEGEHGEATDTVGLQKLCGEVV